MIREGHAINLSLLFPTFRVVFFFTSLFIKTEPNERLPNFLPREISKQCRLFLFTLFECIFVFSMCIWFQSVAIERNTLFEMAMRDNCITIFVFPFIVIKNKSEISPSFLVSCTRSNLVVYGCIIRHNIC